jgi:Tfp pilus assembly protein FimT
MRMRKKSGFTGIELGISILIILTILAFFAPTFLSVIATYKLQSAAHEVATDISNARVLAENENTTVRIDFTSGSYQIVRVSDNSVFKARNLADYSVGTSEGSFTFYSRGTSSSGSIVLSNHLQTKTINVNVLGRVRVS